MLLNKRLIGRFLTFFAILFTSSVHAQTVNELFHHSSDPVIGNPRGSITIVEFFDYECSHCASMVPVINRIVSANPSVRFVYKDLPVLGPMSSLAARAALAAKKQGAYLPFNRALFNSYDLTEGTIFDIAKKLGLNTSQLKTDMYSSSVSAQLNSNLRLARALGIPGTPAFYIGRTNATSVSDLQYLSGEASQRELQDAINKS